jgi:predicted Abi (CAAX) family protease
VTIVVPQLRRGENSLLLWNTSNLTAPIYTFVGHTDAVLEFQWRHQKLGMRCRTMLRISYIINIKYNIVIRFVFVENSEFELVTWSKDQCLRIFKINPFIKKVNIHYILIFAFYKKYYEILTRNFLLHLVMQ